MVVIERLLKAFEAFSENIAYFFNVRLRVSASMSVLASRIRRAQVFFSLLFFVAISPFKIYNEKKIDCGEAYYERILAI